MARAGHRGDTADTVILYVSVIIFSLAIAYLFSSGEAIIRWISH